MRELSLQYSAQIWKRSYVLDVDVVDGMDNNFVDFGEFECFCPHVWGFSRGCVVDNSLYFTSSNTEN